MPRFFFCDLSSSEEVVIQGAEAVAAVLLILLILLTLLILLALLAVLHRIVGLSRSRARRSAAARCS